MASGRIAEQGTRGTASDIRDLTRVLGRAEQDGTPGPKGTPRPPRYSEDNRRRLVQLLKEALRIVTDVECEPERVRAKR